MPKRGPVVEVIIKAKDLTAQALAGFRRRWQAATRVVRDLTRAVIAGTAAFAGMVLGMQRLAAQGDKVIAVKAAFARITGNATEALEQLREAAQNTISDLELMTLANQAVTLGAAKTVDQFAEMVRISRILGRAQGVDARSALESLTIGLARQSPRILDNIGLQVQLGDTTTFTARVMEQARQKVAELTGGMDAGAMSAGQFSTALANLKDKLAEVVAESPMVAAFFDGFTGIVNDIIDLFSGDAELLVEGMKAIGRMAGDAFSIGVNEGIEAFVDKGNWFGRMVAGWFGGNADVARGNMEANREALASIARAAAAQAEARRVSRGGAPAGGGGAGGYTPGADVLLGRILPQPGAGGVGGISPLNSLSPLGPTRFQRRQRLIAENFRDPSMENIEEAAESFDEAAQIGVAAFGSMAEAAIRGSDQVAQSVISMITNILRSLPGVGGLGGAIIGAVGGIFGAVVGKRNREPVRVQVSDFERDAERKLQERRTGPERITYNILNGQSIDEIEYDLRRRSRTDAISRFPHGTGLRRSG